jgi:monovalent cation:H+ antiporter-2, CPA2 family
MTGYTALVSDLALILIIAGIVTVIFKFLRQPLVLGYIIAGVLTGPYVTFVSTVSNIESVEFWGKIGVVFLLFGLGLEFNFRKLKKVGGTGFITVFFEAVIMFSMGFLVGKVLGMHHSASLFLGGMLSISSTSIIIKAFDDLGLKNRKFTQSVFGVLVVEDVVAVLMLVLLPAIAVGKNFDGGELLSKILWLSFFLLFWFTVGIFFIPTMFRKLKRFLTDETLIIVSLGLCLMMVAITLKAGISEALGAFVMGSILSGTVQSEKIIKLTRPIKDFFGAIFFVSVGMLVDPHVAVDYWPLILLITITVLLAKPLSATIGFLFGGQTLKNAIQSGICLCQIGEFSFIIASVGRNLKIMDSYIYPVIVMVSLLTTFITPYWIKLADPLFNTIYKRSKPQWRTVMDRLGTGRTTLDKESDWHKLLQSYFIRIFIYAGWIIFVIIFFTRFATPFVKNHLNLPFSVEALMLILNILVMSPFLYGLLRRKDGKGLFEHIWEDKKFARGPLLFMKIIKYLLAILAVTYTVSYYITGGYGAILIIVACVIVVIVVSKNIKSYYNRIENRFLTNLNSESGGRRPLIIPRELADELHIDKSEVEPNSYLCGKTIGEIHREKRTGALVVRIVRGGRIINLPSKNELIFPGDIVVLLGNDTQMNSFRMLTESTAEPCNLSDIDADIELCQVTLSAGSPLLGENTNITNFMERFGLLIVGLEKSGNNSLITPNSSVRFEEKDTVWIVGNKNVIKKLE